CLHHRLHRLHVGGPVHRPDRVGHAYEDDVDAEELVPLAPGEGGGVDLGAEGEQRGEPPDVLPLHEPERAARLGVEDGDDGALGGVERADGEAAEAAARGGGGGGNGGHVLLYGGGAVELGGDGERGAAVGVREALGLLDLRAGIEPDAGVDEVGEHVGGVHLDGGGGFEGGGVGCGLHGGKGLWPVGR